MSYRNKVKNYMGFGYIMICLMSQACGNVAENELGRLRVQGKRL